MYAIKLSLHSLNTLPTPLSETSPPSAVTKNHMQLQCPGIVALSRPKTNRNKSSFSDVATNKLQANRNDGQTKLINAIRRCSNISGIITLM